MLYGEQKPSDSNEIMFFQNKQYKALEVIETGKSTVQAILSCILWGKAAHSIQLLELASFIKEEDMLDFFVSETGAVLMGTMWEACGG